MASLVYATPSEQNCCCVRLENHEEGQQLEDVCQLTWTTYRQVCSSAWGGAESTFHEASIVYRLMPEFSVYGYPISGRNTEEEN